VTDVKKKVGRPPKYAEGMVRCGLRLPQKHVDFYESQGDSFNDGVRNVADRLLESAGRDDGVLQAECPSCDGKGVIGFVRDVDDIRDERCQTCNGEGKLDFDEAGVANFYAKGIPCQK